MSEELEYALRDASIFRRERGKYLSKSIKRIIDFGFSILFILVFLPVFMIFSALIIFFDGGPVFIDQERVGRDGRKFKCYKFRTMVVNADDILDGWKEQNNSIYQEYVLNNFKLSNDPRITTMGLFLRKTSIDEFPQVLNVLMGEMSFVGPRPILPREEEIYGSPLSIYMTVRPGITGLWQVSGRSGTTFSDRVRYDIEYIQNWSIMMDVLILLRTIYVVIIRRGAC